MRTTKAHLIEALVENKGFTREDAEIAVNGMIDAIVSGLRVGDVNLSNVGTLRLETASERVRRNPQTGEIFTTPAQKVVRWTASPTLTHYINDRISRDTLSTKAPKGSL